MKALKERPEIFKIGADHPDYNPNFEYGKKRIGSAATKFETVCGRAHPIVARSNTGSKPPRNFFKINI